MNTIPIFVYGTLRPDCGLGDYYLQHADHYGIGILPDADLWRHYGARFPVLTVNGADRNSNDTVRGDVYLARLDDPRLAAMVEMEQGAGYVSRWVDVLTEHCQWLTCMAFVWPDTYPVGPYIPSGDWKAADAQRIRNELPVGTGFAARKDNSR